MTEISELMKSILMMHWGEESNFLNFANVKTARYDYTESHGSFQANEKYTFKIEGEFYESGALIIEIHDENDNVLIGAHLEIEEPGEQILINEGESISEFEITEGYYITIEFSSEAVGNCKISSIEVTNSLGAPVDIGNLIVRHAWKPSEGTILYGIDHLFPLMPDDYQGAISACETADVAYFYMSKDYRSVRGIGYYYQKRGAPFQLHLYGPKKNRGLLIKEEVERILRKRNVRIRPDGDGILFLDGMETKNNIKVGYAFIYDLRLIYNSEVI